MQYEKDDIYLKGLSSDFLGVILSQTFIALGKLKSNLDGSFPKVYPSKNKRVGNQINPKVFL